MSMIVPIATRDDIGPRLFDQCPEYRHWIAECARAGEAGDDERFALAWRRAVRAAAGFRAALMRPAEAVLQ